MNGGKLPDPPYTHLDLLSTTYIPEQKHEFNILRFFDLHIRRPSSIHEDCGIIIVVQVPRKLAGTSFRKYYNCVFWILMEQFISSTAACRQTAAVEQKEYIVEQNKTRYQRPTIPDEWGVDGPRTPTFDFIIPIWSCRLPQRRSTSPRRCRVACACCCARPSRIWPLAGTLPGN